MKTTDEILETARKLLLSFLNQFRRDEPLPDNYLYDPRALFDIPESLQGHRMVGMEFDCDDDGGGGDALVFVDDRGQIVTMLQGFDTYVTPVVENYRYARGGDVPHDLL